MVELWVTEGRGLYYRQLISMTREAIGIVHENSSDENCFRMKWVTRRAVMMITILYGSVSDVSVDIAFPLLLGGAVWLHGLLLSRGQRRYFVKLWNRFHSAAYPLW